MFWICCGHSPQKRFFFVPRSRSRTAPYISTSPRDIYLEEPCFTMEIAEESRKASYSVAAWGGLLPADIVFFPSSPLSTVPRRHSKAHMFRLKDSSPSNRQILKTQKVQSLLWKRNIPTHCVHKENNLYFSYKDIK